MWREWGAVFIDLFKEVYVTVVMAIKKRRLTVEISQVTYT